MKAVVFDQFGPPHVLRIKDIDKPIPSDDEVCIKIHASSVTKYDTWMRSLTAPPGFKFLMRLASGRKPKQPVLGTECSGVIESIGNKVSEFNIGDAVIGYNGMQLGMHSQFTTLPVQSVCMKPDNIDFSHAAVFLQGALTAHFFLEKADILPGQEVLIYGASGGVGGYAVQLAKHYYHANVTAVCSGAKARHVSKLGADKVIDYRTQDFAADDHLYDVIFDTVGKTRVRATIKTIKDGGYYLLATFSLSMLMQILLSSAAKKIHFEYGTLKETQQDMIKIKEMIESGIIIPDLDRAFSFEDVISAHEFVESGSKNGNVALVFSSNS